jgi:hypothetical protein
MKRQRAKEMPTAVAQVRVRIDTWRQDRPHKSSPMPQELWLAAAELAPEHGAHPVARALGINFYKLSLHVLQSHSDPHEQPTPYEHFVQVKVCDPLLDAPSSTLVEMAGADGAKMTMELQAATFTQLLALADAFWRRP